MTREIGTSLRKDSHPGKHSLARRISGWTSNLLATAIVLVASLGLGRQLVEWWGVDGQADLLETPAPPLNVAPTLNQVALLEFGDAAHLVERQSFPGTREAALAHMREACRRIVQTGTAPNETPKPKETSFLQRTAERQPIAQEPGRWQLHQFEGTFPIVVGIGITPDSAGQPLAEPSRRVLAWSLGAPAGQNAWTLYTWQAAASNSAHPRSTEIPLPAESRRTLSLGGLAGETTIGFTGQASPAVWQQHFDRVAAERKWLPADWKVAAGVWHARFRSADEAQVVDVQFALEPEQQLVGLIVTTITPTARP